jgi:O-antigen ligase
MLAVAVLFPHFFGLSVVFYIVFLVYAGFRRTIYFKLDKMGYLWIAFYGIYLIGFLWTNHSDIALKTLEYKLAFVLIPLLLGFKPLSGQIRLDFVLLGLILALTAASVYGVLNSMSCFASGGGRTCFLTGFISPIHHPTYFMVYWITAMSGAWYGRMKGWKYFSLKWIIPFTILGLILHVLSLSLAGILFLMICIFVLLVYAVSKRFGRFYGILSFFLLPVFGVLFITRAPQVEGEWHAAKWYADEYFKDPKGFVQSRVFPMSGSEERLVLWTVSIEEIKRHPFGVGTGNTESTLEHGLNAMGQIELAQLNRNPHNQFMQTTLETGIVGLVLFLTILVFGITLGIKIGNPLLVLVSFCLAFNSLFESMLQRQSGVVFFTLLLCVLSSSSLLIGSRRKPLDQQN